MAAGKAAGSCCPLTDLTGGQYGSSLKLRDWEAPAALANTSLLMSHDLKMHQLTARELATAKKC